MAIVISLTDQRIDVFGNGSHIMSITAQTPKEVPDSFVLPLASKGVAPYDEKAKVLFEAPKVAAPEVAVKVEVKSTETLNPEKVNRIAEAMMDIEMSNDDEKMTSGGQVRASAIEEMIGEDTTLEERKAAIALMVA